MKPPIRLDVCVGRLSTVEAVRAFVARVLEIQTREVEEMERARMLGRIKNSRTDVRERG